jgi:UrcA family protein
MRKILVGAAVGVLASALVGGVALAQKMEEVKVEATRIVNTKVLGRTASGVPIVSLSLSYGVSVAGLNLATSAGAADLEKRVKDAAQAACKEISRQYPEATPSDAECTKVTADAAMVRVHELTGAAHKAAAK